MPDFVAGLLTKLSPQTTTCLTNLVLIDRLCALDRQPLSDIELIFPQAVERSGSILVVCKGALVTSARIGRFAVRFDIPISHPPRR
jgi:hypothetical protein